MSPDASGFLADHDLNEHILDGVARREPSIEFSSRSRAGARKYP